MGNSVALHGVNLGGWLVLERWITPSLFAGSNAGDEYSLCAAASSHQKLLRHRRRFITEQDFAWLAAHGINAVRIPVGYWALQDDPPYINCAGQLDQAFAWAAEHGMKILLDMHGAPGSQNGRDHSGRIGRTAWPRRPNIDRTLAALEQLCRRYGTQPALWGIELLNEPGWKVLPYTLQGYYRRAYEVVRRNCGKEVAVVLNDIYRPLRWNRFMADGALQNLAFDLHLYQCFSPWDKALSLERHLQKARGEWSSLIGRINRPVIVGEWSLGLDPKTFRGLDDQQQHAAMTAYANVQLEAFKQAQGWFFWTYKTENMPGWSFRDSVETGIIHL